MKEEIPDNVPRARGKGFVICLYVDADHAGNQVTRRSRTGFLVFCNSALIHWHSRKQTGVETSTFGSEFMAMKQGCEYIHGLHYKLRMMGIPVEGFTCVYGDNQSVLVNTSNSDSTLKKKSNSIAYHFVREGCAKDEWRTTYIKSEDNMSDMLTKPLVRDKRVKHVSKLLKYFKVFTTKMKSSK